MAKLIGYDVAFFVLDVEMGQFYEGESEWADSLEDAKRIGDSADCDFYIVFRTAQVLAPWGPAEGRAEILYTSPLRKNGPAL